MTCAPLHGRPPGHDSKGRAFRWVARRQRKRVLQPQLHLRPLPTLDWLGWLDARRHWKKLGWWIALLYTLGSILFCISGVAGEIQSVGGGGSWVGWGGSGGVRELWGVSGRGGRLPVLRVPLLVSAAGLV